MFPSSEACHRRPIIGSRKREQYLYCAWMVWWGSLRALSKLSGFLPRPSDTLPFGVTTSRRALRKGWRQRLTPGRSVSLNGVRLPVAARELVMPLKMDGDPLRVVLSFRGRGDRFMDVDLRAVPSSNSSLRVRVPRAARGGLVLGMTFAPTEPDVHNATPASGTLELGQFRVRTADGIHRLAMDIGQWIGVGGIRSRPSRNGVRLRYFVTNDVVSRFRPKQPTDQSPVPVIATAPIAELADPNGLLPLQVEGEPFVGRVVATARRFPTVSGDFVLADREALSTALNADAPGSAVVDEIWLKSPSASDEERMKAVLSRSAFAGFETSFRGDLRAELDREPVARASILALLVSAVVGFVLALAGLALALTTDIRDERAELFDLEAQGATPALLRRHLRLRSFGVLGFGVLFGLGLGAILSTIVVDVVRVTAGGQVPEPPLLLSFDWPLLLGAIGLFVSRRDGCVDGRHLAGASGGSSRAWHGVGTWRRLALPTSFASTRHQKATPLRSRDSRSRLLSTRSWSWWARADLERQRSCACSRGSITLPRGACAYLRRRSPT